MSKDSPKNKSFSDYSTSARIGKNDTFGDDKVNLKVTEQTRFVATGRDINCKVHPLNPERYQDARRDAEFDFPPANVTRFAYVWYATRPSYLCSAIVAMKILKERRRREGGRFPYQVDYLLVHTARDVEGDESSRLLKMWRAEGGRDREFPANKKEVADYYYRGMCIYYVLVKFNRKGYISM